MIIRSQDKKNIVNFSNVDRIRIQETDIWINAKDGIFRIGAYSTEEKAIKVLNMIQSAYNAIETMKIDGGAWRDNHYFEMPQDSEV